MKPSMRQWTDTVHSKTDKQQSFKTREPHEFIFSPYCLKEFRNRWFVYGRRPNDRLRDAAAQYE